MAAITVQNVFNRYHRRQIGYNTLREEIYRVAGKLVRRGNHDQGHYLWALKDVSFEIQEGEKVGVIGRNGSGKTTLLRLLAGVTNPTTGKISHKGSIGALIELTAGFHPELTGRENIYLSGAIVGMSQRQIRSQFDEIVAFSGLEEFIDMAFKHYSTGMKARLGFAVASQMKPDILLVDEVLSVGDVAFQQKCLAKMENTASQGGTVVFVSHSVEQVARLCERCILLEDGRIQADGDVQSVLETYTGKVLPCIFKESLGQYDLTKRPNPLLEDRLILHGIRLLNSDGIAQDEFVTGQEMAIVVEVEGISDYPDAVIGVGFMTIKQEKVASIDTGMTCSYIDLPRHPRELAILRIPRLPFVPGDYWVNLWVMARLRNRIVRIDEVRRAALFSVRGADVYGTGYKLSADYGSIYLGGTWEIRGINDPTC